MFARKKKKNFLTLSLQHYFDETYYLSNNSDVEKDGADPFVHYEIFGSKEGRDPNRWFNVNYYLETYPDVKLDNENNPFLHYLTFGWKEKRLPNQYTPLSFYETITSPDEIHNYFSKEKMRELKSVQSENYRQTIIDEKIDDIYPFYDTLKDTEFINDNFFIKNVLIIAVTGISQCTKYRIMQMKNILENSGYRVYVLDHMDFLRSMNKLQRVSKVILYRLEMSEEFKAYLKECNRLNIKIYYDIDDPIFDEKTVIENKNILYLDKNIQQNLEKDATSHASVMKLIPNFIVSTIGLQTLINQKFNIDSKNIIVRKNAIDYETSYLSKIIIDKKINQDNKIIKIIYGTPSLAHSGDFSVCLNALMRVLIKYRNKVKLILIGDIKLSDEFKNFKESIIVKPVGNYAYFLNLLSEADINIVPLLNNKFNATKSNIKFLDASSVKTASICSNIGDYKILQNTKEVLLVNNEDEWFNALSFLIENSEERNLIANNAYKTVMDSYAIDKIGKIFTENFERLEYETKVINN